MVAATHVNLARAGHQSNHALALDVGQPVGYLARFSKHFSIGASYQSSIFMSKLEKYAGLFAGHGGFDIPSNWTAESRKSIATEEVMQ